MIHQLFPTTPLAPTKLTYNSLCNQYDERHNIPDTPRSADVIYPEQHSCSGRFFPRVISNIAAPRRPLHVNVFPLKKGNSRIPHEGVTLPLCSN